MSSYKSLKKMGVLILPLLLVEALYEVEGWFLRIGFLNTKDLGFVGFESGTFYEYLTNIWY